MVLVFIKEKSKWILNELAKNVISQSISQPANQSTAEQFPQLWY